MNTKAIGTEISPAAPFRQMNQRTGFKARAENLVVSLALAVMVVLPLAEAFLRRTFSISILASTAVVQHMVLVVGMLGGAIAAREGRLLSLSTLGETSIRGRLKIASRVLTSSVSAAISAFLCLAAYQFLQTEREAGRILAYGVPVWVVESVLPLGFAVIAIRILRHTSEKCSVQVVAAGFAALVVGIILHLPDGSHHTAAIAPWGSFFSLRSWACPHLPRSGARRSFSSGAWINRSPPFPLPIMRW